jgi:competence protein ComEC
LAFNYFSISVRFGWYRLAGITLHLLLFLLACILVHENDIRNNKNWIGHYPGAIDALIVTLEEPLEEKAKSFKALATVSRVVRNDSLYPSCGRIILYLEKKEINPGLGSRLLIRPRLQPIEDFENPTGFSYKHYCALQNIYHRQFLKAGDYIILPDKNSSPFQERLFVLRQHIITILRTYIKGEKEAGLAEALLIGYKNDLDKKLVQSYTNTRVVHVIAISGLHVGLIYSILLMLLVPLTAHRYARWMRPFLLLAGLWIFSLLAGGAPSVVRSTVMFSGIVLGKTLRKGNSIYNSLAASAFLLLCYNPLWLWEVGFQLSYLAVLSIVMFMNPIYNLLYVQNKMLDPLWRMAAVTLSAQILTTPVCLYYFHQFPNLFLITNIVAVPLSSLILAGELLLCGLAFFPAAAAFTGQILEWLIRCLNSFITYMEKMPFALSTGLGISIYQVIILYGIIAVITAMKKRT